MHAREEIGATARFLAVGGCARGRHFARVALHSGVTLKRTAFYSPESSLSALTNQTRAEF
jgi:hypothetical protein